MLVQRTIQIAGPSRIEYQEHLSEMSTEDLLNKSVHTTLKIHSSSTMILRNYHAEKAKWLKGMEELKSCLLAREQELLAEK